LAEKPDSQKNEKSPQNDPADLAASLAALTESLRKNPSDSDEWVRIADLFRDMGRTSRALEIYSWIAKKLALDGRLLPAVGIVKQILALDPLHRETQQAVARLYALRSSPDRREAFQALAVETAAAARKALARPASIQGTAIVPEDIDTQVDELFDRILDQHDRSVTAAGAAPAKGDDGIDEMLSRIPVAPLFSRLTAEEFREVVERSSLQKWAPGEVVTREGDHGEAFYVVTGGTAGVSKLNSEGQPQQLVTLKEGDFFGELAFFSDGLRSATVTAATGLEALVIDRVVLAELIGVTPSVREALLDHYRERLVGTVLRMSPFFRPLDDEDRRRLVSQFEYVEVSIGDCIVREGQISEGFFVILAGEIGVTERGGAKRTVEIARMKEGEFFGEIGILAGVPATANCIAIRSSKLFRLSRERFADLVATHPRILELLTTFARSRLERSTAHGLIVNRDELARTGLV